MYKQLTKLAAATLLASPLAAQWSDGWQLPVGYNPSFWDECGQRFYGEVDYLLWYANQEGSSFASTFDIFGVTQNAKRSENFRTKDEFFRNNWDSGVRAVLGYKPPCRTWDVRGAYVYFANQSRRGFDPLTFNEFTTTTFTGQSTIISGSAFGVDYLPLVPLNFLNNTGSFQLSSIVSNLSAKWNLNFNQADIEFGREFYVACDVTVRPFFGLRGLWENQKYNVRNTLAVSGTTTRGGGPGGAAIPNAHRAIGSPVTEFVTLNFDPSSRFDGFGARAGFDASITLWNCLDLYGNLAGSILWGNAKTKERVTIISVTDLTNIVIQTEQAVHSHHTSVLNLDFGLGFRWNQWMNCGRNLLSLKFGWEQHVYTNINQLQNSVLANVSGLGGTSGGNGTFDRNIYRGDLSLSGFIFGVDYLY